MQDCMNKSLCGMKVGFVSSWLELLVINFAHY
jgi:hypothetical protein